MPRTLQNSLANKNTNLFKLYVKVVALYILGYVFIYWLIGARLSAVLLVGPFALTLLVYRFETIGYRNLARVGFSLAGLLAIFFGGAGIAREVGTDYYYLASMVLPYLIFEASQKKLIYLCLALPPLFWVADLWTSFAYLPDYWVVKSLDYVQEMKTINGLGASCIIAIFLANYSTFVEQFSKTLETLKDTTEQLGEAQSVARFGIWTFNPVSGESVWSKQMYEILGYNPQYGSPSYSQQAAAIYAEDQPVWRKRLQECIEKGTPYRCRYRVEVLGELRWIESHGRAKFDSRSGTTLINGTCQDISELIHAEESARLERAKAIHNSKMAALGEMAAGVAHEINNPMAIISGMARLLPTHFSNPAEMTKKIDSIERAANRVTRIVSGLKKFSRSSENTEFRRVCLADIIQEAIVLTSTKCARHDVSVLFEKSLFSQIQCDEIEIEQVLVILINNAVDAVKEYEERWIQIQLAESLSKITLRISDSGKGIPKVTVEKLFNPFFTTKPVGQGTGLGLSIARGILEVHGATIEYVQGTPNTCFEIRFPLAEELKSAA